MRDLYPGIGQAVGERTVLRKVVGEFEDWDDVAYRTAYGNVALDPDSGDFDRLYYHTREGNIIWSGRHLQHGDETQPDRNMEVFTNCSTAATCALSFGLLLQGSGVGRCYDDDMMLVDWDMAPNLILRLSEDHPDYDLKMVDDLPEEGYFISHTVQDSREGWMKALEIYETMTFNRETDKTLVLDFSYVREKNAPINGMQGRPSCGPIPTMQSFKDVRDKVVGNGHDTWFQNFLVDHFFAHSVMVGGARRSARIAVKSWKDPGIFDFIECKYKYRDTHDLYSSNNSVSVDQEFWELTKNPDPSNDLSTLAVDVFNAVTDAAYHHGTGEPGFLNLDKICQNEDGLNWEELYKGEWAGSDKYKFNEETKEYHGLLARVVHHKKYKFIVNPCAEIPLFVLGGFCVIGDIVPFHCKDFGEFCEAARLMARALIRVNTMDSIYSMEVQRTNRIGVSLTGIHEWMWLKHRTSFLDVTEGNYGDVAKDLDYVRKEVERAANEYSDELGLNHPHTYTTIKPAGTTSKLFGLTEGCHLPSMSVYLRWVQFRKDDPLVVEYGSHGYPVKALKSKPDSMLIGFPTRLPFGEMDLGSKLMYAGEANMPQQFRWLMFLEKYWIGENGNQVSYTLKYDPKKVSYQDFRDHMLHYIKKIRCVSVMPQIDMTAYEYQPEEPITVEEYEDMVSHIERMKEDIGVEHVDCGSGGCPIDFKEGES